MNTQNIISKLAWRNVWRNKRRTLLTLLTIMVGSAMIIFMNSIAKGGHEQMIEDAVALNTGHIQIHEKGFWENQTIDYAFQPRPDLLKYLDTSPHVTGYAERVISGGLLSFGDNTRGVLIQGISPGREPQVTDLCKKILPGGRFLISEDAAHTIIGKTLAKNIGAKVGDSIAVISQSFDGSIAAERFSIVGIFESGSPEYDREMMLIPLSQADETFTMMGYVHSLLVRIDKASNSEEVKHDLIALASHQKVQLEVMGWDELMPELIQFIIMDDVSGHIFIFILFMIVAFGVLNTIQMSVFERTREFGVMLSIGTRPGQISGMILIESVFISVLGIMMGAALGYCISLYFQINPIDYSAYADEIALWGISTTVYPAKITSLNIIVTSMLTLGLALLFSMFPARRAAKLNPIEAIRKL